MVVLFLQIEITISISHEPKLSRAYDIHSFLEVPFLVKFFLFPTCFSDCYSREVFLAF
jgi:hypothetical protein